MNLEHAASLKTSIENGNYVTSCFLPCNYPSPIKWTKNSNQCLNLHSDKGFIYLAKNLVKVLSKLMNYLWQSLLQQRQVHSNDLQKYYVYPFFRYESWYLNANVQLNFQ